MNLKLDEELKRVIIISVIGMTFFLISDLFFKLVTYQSIYLSESSGIFMILMSCVIYTLILTIVKKASTATKICYIMIFILNFINQIKIIYTNEPLYFSDVKFINQIGGLTQLVIKNISIFSLLVIIGIFAIYGFILHLLVKIAQKNEIELKNKKIRIIVLIIDILILLALFIPSKYTKDFYLKVFFNNDEYKDYNSYTTNLKYYYRTSFINGMYGVLLNNRFYEPDNYDENLVNELLEETPENSENNLGKPNIIIYSSESFWDIDQVSEVEFDKPITQNFNSLKSKGKFINLVSPTYGGMSENTIFEILTGGSMSYFPLGYIPIMSLYSRPNSENIPSLVDVLKNNGYYSKIIFGRDYYNSKKTYEKVGFDEYIELDYENIDITDEYFTDNLIKELEKKNKNVPYLYMVSSLEGHMPYTEDKYDNYDISIVNSEFDDDMNIVFKAYAQSLYNADKQLGRLYDYINTYDEPTIIIFFGDHLPFLRTEDGLNVMAYLDYFIKGDALTQYYKMYNTQALVLANFDISGFDMPDYLSTNLLFNYIVNNMNIEN